MPLVHTEEVTGSIPASPTRSAAISTSVGIAVGAIPVARAGTLPVTRTTRTVAKTHAGLTRAIRHAEANDKVRRNVATLVDTPVGQERRPSKSLTFGQAVALIRAARSYGLHAYVVLSLLVGVRTEEARALRWITSTWRATRTPTRLYLPMSTSGAPYVPTEHQDEEVPALFGIARMAVEVLRERLQRQADARLRAGVLWQDNGRVFTTALGTQLDAAH